MRHRYSHTIATTLCALALSMGNASHARAGEQGQKAPSEAVNSASAATDHVKTIWMPCPKGVSDCGNQIPVMRGIPAAHSFWSPTPSSQPVTTHDARRPP